jgi:hypothetical protein
MYLGLNVSKNPPLHLLPFSFQLLSADTHTVANISRLTFVLFSVTLRRGSGDSLIFVVKMLLKIKASTQNMVFIPELSGRI